MIMKHGQSEKIIKCRHFEDAVPSSAGRSSIFKKKAISFGNESRSHPWPRVKTGNRAWLGGGAEHRAPSRVAAEAPPPPPASRSENQLAQQPRCHTNCLEAPLSRAFRQLGWKVGSQPWIFLLLPMVLTAVLGTGLIYQPQDEDDHLEEQYAPVGRPTKARCALRTRAPVSSPPPIPLFFAWERNKGLNLKTITFPIYSQAGQIVYPANILGGTALGERMGLSPKVMRLQRHLKTGEGEEKERSKACMIHFLRSLAALKRVCLALKKIKVPSGWGL
ncbi:unnamed protein product [Rangifer tarandus platyrhynchus]|uniref:Uncharacterized protein n=2 Tax=Rangifer tarandus platyrhynchus TaxID=3082113 RepID=A0ABN8XXD6_RANTA|nr:unnamed protein product [Rangifer tarandus platyrhynchus]CAI9713359.1 unnamed protein product [Rangifer tarandus platyrhynchus]